jgi:hypothetical protein
MDYRREECLVLGFRFPLLSSGLVQHLKPPVLARSVHKMNACNAARMGDMRNTHIWSENLKGRDHFEYIGVYERIILKWTFTVGGWIGFIWLWIGTSGWLLWIRWWNFGLYKKWSFLTSWATDSFSRRTLLHSYEKAEVRPSGRLYASSPGYIMDFEILYWKSTLKFDPV